MSDKETMRQVADALGYTSAEFEVMWMLYLASRPEVP